MKIEQSKWTASTGWMPSGPPSIGTFSQLVLVFGAVSALEQSELRRAIQESYPSVCIVGCSTAGEIYGTAVLDDSLIATAVHFEHSQFKAVHADLGQFDGSLQAAGFLAKQLPSSLPALNAKPAGELAHVLVEPSKLLQKIRDCLDTKG